MVGSYAMPGWLERLKTDYFARRISHHDLEEIYDAAAKAAIKDQEIAGLDVITDGEPRRDNIVDYFLERLPGVQIDRSSKKFYYDFYDSSVHSKLPTASLGLVRDFQFLRTFTDRATKICITGPHCLTKRLRNQFYPTDEALAMDIARVMNLELKALAKATSWGRWKQPQSGSTATRSAGMTSSALRICSATISGVSTSWFFTSITPTPRSNGGLNSRKRSRSSPPRRANSSDSCCIWASSTAGKR